MRGGRGGTRDFLAGPGVAVALGWHGRASHRAKRRVLDLGLLGFQRHFPSVAARASDSTVYVWKTPFPFADWPSERAVDLSGVFAVSGPASAQTQ